jgi:hypothetical protein
MVVTYIKGKLQTRGRKGKWLYIILLLLGVPVPVVFLIWLIGGGCG